MGAEMAAVCAAHSTPPRTGSPQRLVESLKREGLHAAAQQQHEKTYDPSESLQGAVSASYLLVL
jgi:hypothetical protein